MAHFRRVRGQVCWRKKDRALGVSAGLKVAIDVVRAIPKPNNPDTDGDGILDGAEYFGWSSGTPHSDNPPGPNNIPNYVWDDLESRALILYNPNNYITDPSESDTDGDGILDGLELDFSDGIITNPSSADTDGDGLPDGWIDFNNNGQKDLGEFEDKDCDGIVDSGTWGLYGDLILNYEYYGKGPGETDPRYSDSDNDGLSD